MSNETLPFLKVNEVDQLVEWLGGRVPWSDLDDAVAVVLYRFFGEHEIKMMVRHISKSTGSKMTTPVEVMNWIGETIVNDRLTEVIGSTHSKEVSDVDLKTLRLDLDPDAMNMLVRGASEQAVSIFHNLAPENYWSRVAKYVETEMDEDMTLLDVYDVLEDEFSWHPMNRRVAS